MSKIEELENQVKEILAELEKLKIREKEEEEKKEEEKEDRSIINFEQDDLLHYIGCYLDIIEYEFEYDATDPAKSRVYNAFRTEEAAAKARYKVLVTLFFSQFASVHETHDWEPDWGNIEQWKYYIYFDLKTEVWRYLTSSQEDFQGVPMSKECAEKCIKYCNKHFPNGVIKELD